MSIAVSYMVSGMLNYYHTNAIHFIYTAELSHGTIQLKPTLLQDEDRQVGLQRTDKPKFVSKHVGHRCFCFIIDNSTQVVMSYAMTKIK